MLELFTGSGYESIGEALAPVRSGFTDALAGAGEGPHRNALTIAGTELRVDQVRGIASMVGGADGWTERAGKQLIRNDTRQGRLFLAYVVGTGRYLSADDFELILTRICRGAMHAIREMDVAQLVNMVVAEPIHDPARALPVWVTVALKLASGRGDDYFTQEIPELATGYDQLYAEIPAGAEFADALLPQASRPLEPTLPRYEARLLSSVLPSTAEEVARLSTDGEREAAFAAHEPELVAYVREHLLSRVD
ncbi:MAG: hypothetical protein ACRDK0_13335, partial [Solirubrobacteraceae bacterium]